MTYDYEIDDGAHAQDQQIQLDWHRGYQVIDAAGGSNLLSAGSGSYDVDAASGDINAGGTTVSCAAETVDLSGVVDPDDPRKVTVYRDTNGNLSYQAGTPQPAVPSGATRRNATEPAPPTLAGTDAVVLGTVWVAAGASSVVDADIRDRRMPAELNTPRLARSVDAQGNDITNVGALSTEQIGSERHYAGAYDGSDADSRLDNALAAASDGDVIYLENAQYTADRTISKTLVIEGTRQGGSTIVGVWTINGRFSEISRCFVSQNNGGQLLVNIDRCHIHTITGSGDPFISVADDNVLLAGIVSFGNSVEFQSNTSGGLASQLVDTSVTGNSADNTVGDVG
jgi:hypothetical protein